MHLQTLDKEPRTDTSSTKRIIVVILKVGPLSRHFVWRQTRDPLIPRDFCRIVRLENAYTTLDKEPRTDTYSTKRIIVVIWKVGPLTRHFVWRQTRDLLIPRDFCRIVRLANAYTNTRQRTSHRYIVDQANYKGLLKGRSA